MFSAKFMFREVIIVFGCSQDFRILGLDFAEFQNLPKCKCRGAGSRSAPLAKLRHRTDPYMGSQWASECIYNVYSPFLRVQ